MKRFAYKVHMILMLLTATLLTCNTSISFCEELAPGYNACLKKVNTSLSNAEIRGQVYDCLEKAEDYWNKRLGAVLQKVQKSNERYDGKRYGYGEAQERYKSDMKKYQDTFKAYSDATEPFLTIYGSAINTAPEELKVKTLSDFVIALENFYRGK